MQIVPENYKLRLIKIDIEVRVKVKKRFLFVQRCITDSAKAKFEHFNAIGVFNPLTHVFTFTYRR